LKRTHDPEAHRRIFESLIDQGLLECIRNHDKTRIDDMLIPILGQKHGYDWLLDQDV